MSASMDLKLDIPIIKKKEEDYREKERRTSKFL